MLTKSDLQAIGKLIDEKLSTDIAAIQTRIADIEKSQISPLSWIQMRNTLKEVERRIVAQETRLAKIESTMVTKNYLKQELNPIKSKLNKVSRDLKATMLLFDSDIIDHSKKIDRIERHLNLPSIASA